jgi:hypothetical protein
VEGSLPFRYYMAASARYLLAGKRSTQSLNPTLRKTVYQNPQFSSNDRATYLFPRMPEESSVVPSSPSPPLPQKEEKAGPFRTERIDQLVDTEVSRSGFSVYFGRQVTGNVFQNRRWDRSTESWKAVRKSRISSFPFFRKPSQRESRTGGVASEWRQWP